MSNLLLLLLQRWDDGIQVMMNPYIAQKARGVGRGRDNARKYCNASLQTCEVRRGPRGVIVCSVVR